MKFMSFGDSTSSSVKDKLKTMRELAIVEAVKWY